MRYLPIICAAFLAAQPMLQANIKPKDNMPKLELDKDMRERVVESLSLNGVPMKEAARLIGLATHKPIIVSTDAANVIVDVHVRNLSAEAALRSICQASGLWFQKNHDDGLIHVTTFEEFARTLQFNNYPDEPVVVQILYPSAEDVGDAIAKLFLDKVIWIEPKDSSGNKLTDISEALERMDLLADRGTFDIVDEDSGSSSDTESDDDEGDNDDEDREKFLEALAINPEMIDSSILQKNIGMGSKDKLAMRFGQLANRPDTVFMTALPENNSLLLRSSSKAAVAEILDTVKKLDKPIPQVLLEVKVLSIRLDDSKERAVDLLFASNDGTVSGGFDNGAMSVGGGQNIMKPSEYNPTDGSGLVPQGSGINSSAAIFNVISENVKARIQFLETNDRATELATPNLMVCNNESTTLFMGTETTVMESAQATTTYIETSGGGFQPNVSWEIEAPRRRIGTSLLITPTINTQREVTLRILQEKSTLGGVTKNVYSGGSGAAGSEEQYFLSQDIDLQRVVTTVVGKDRHYMVIGGLITEELGKVEEKVPGLCEIPILGELIFTRMTSERVRSEVLIIIRPFVMLAPGEEQLVSQSYLERMSQHPAAREDLPSLGVNSPSELAKPRVTNPNDPFYIKLYNMLTTWNIDSKNDFDTHDSLEREDRRQYHNEALKEIERIQKNEK